MDDEIGDSTVPVFAVEVVGQESDKTAVIGGVFVFGGAEPVAGEGGTRAVPPRPCGDAIDDGRDDDAGVGIRFDGGRRGSGIAGFDVVTIAFIGDLVGRARGRFSLLPQSPHHVHGDAVHGVADGLVGILKVGLEALDAFARGVDIARRHVVDADVCGARLVGAACAARKGVPATVVDVAAVFALRGARRRRAIDGFDRARPRNTDEVSRTRAAFEGLAASVVGRATSGTERFARLGHTCGGQTLPVGTDEVSRTRAAFELAATPVIERSTRHAQRLARIGRTLRGIDARPSHTDFRVGTRAARQRVSTTIVDVSACDALGGARRRFARRRVDARPLNADLQRGTRAALQRIAAPVVDKATMHALGGARRRFARVSLFIFNALAASAKFILATGMTAFATIQHIVLNIDAHILATGIHSTTAIARGNAAVDDDSVVTTCRTYRRSTHHTPRRLLHFFAPSFFLSHPDARL